MAAQPPRHYHPMDQGTNAGGGGGGGAGYLYHPLAVAGDTTYTKIFVGGLAWETQRNTMRRYFEQFGDILEAVVITDKHTGRSKGYGFVTFKDPDSAMRACQDPTPVIDGRRANCNLASLGAVQRPRHQLPAASTQYYGMGARFRPAMASSALRGSSAASSFAAYYRPAAQYPYPYSFYGYSGGYSQESMYPMTFYGLGGGGAPAHHISPYYTAGQGFTPSIYPYYTQVGQASQPQGAGIGLHYAQGHSYTPYYPQNYGSSPGILSLPITSPTAAGPVGVQFPDVNAGVTVAAMRAPPPSSSQQPGATSTDRNSSA